MTPQQRSTNLLREEGYLVEVVEQIKRIPGKTWRVDLFGFADLLAIRRDEVLLVQVTSRSNVSSRIRKIEDAPTLAPVREAGIRIEVHGWGADSKGKMTFRREDLS